MGGSDFDDGRYDRFKSEKRMYFSCSVGDLIANQYHIVGDYQEGWPQLAAYVSSSKNTRIYRKFGYLRNRVMMYKQDEITRYEERLLELDDRDKETDEHRLYSRKVDEQQEVSSRKELISEIDQKIKEYGLHHLSQSSELQLSLL
jgi:hypothetical protein